MLETVALKQGARSNIRGVVRFQGMLIKSKISGDFLQEWTTIIFLIGKSQNKNGF